MAQTKVKSGLLNFPDQTDFVKLPSGTTAQRPVSPEKGYSRYNTTDNKLEFWNGTEWQQLPGLTPPIITSVSYPGDDLAADPAGGQTITINGGDFKAGATVTVGGTTPSVITFVSAAEITFEAPAKAAGDYDIVVTNTDGGNATSVNGMAYNGVPSWTTPAGNLGTFPAGSTIPTITLVATEPDSGVISYSITTGALPAGLALTGADIDGNVPTPAGDTTYNFSVTASDDENQESTERAFNIVVYLQVINTVSAVDPFGDSSGVALYRLENNANDEGGVYNGTATNVTYGAGVFSQAGIFNGSSSGISNSNITPLSSATEMSVSIWFKRYDTGVQRGAISIGQDGAPGGGILLLAYGYSTIGSGNLFFELGSSIGRYIFDGTTNTNEWYHVTVSCDGDTVNCYLNGSFKGSSTQGIGTIAPSAILNIGGMNVSGGKYHNGEIDQVRIFNRALTPLEVSSLYEERTVICGGQAETVDILGDNSCIALYPLDGNANDLSGNYSGTPVGTISYGVGEFDLAGVFIPSSYINLFPTLGSFFAQKQTLAVSIWWKWDGTTDNNIFSDYANSSFNISLNVNKGGVGKISLVTRYSNSTTTTTSSTSTFNDGNWHHAVAVINQSNLTHQLYVDGNLEGSAGISSASWNGSGQGVGIGGQNFAGSIDQVRIFNKALSAAEVTTLYNETACDVLACSGTTNTLDILGDSSCVAAYPLDGSPADLSGNYNGVQTDVTYPVGKFDLGGSFNGSSSKINIPSSFGIGDIASFSVSLWAKSNNNAVQEWIGGKTTRVLNNHNLTIGPYNSSNQIRIFCGSDANNWVLSQTSSVFYDGLWHNYTFVKNGTNGYFYIDGVLFDSSNVFDSSTTLDPNADQYISASWNGSPRFKGEIDQVRIFNKALSAGEVTTLYNETACN